jgi:NAD(P)-dependent dehydrogenase (short-subunit alcohol dehydrogenase family)
LAGLHLVNRIGKPEDVVDAVALLATNNFISGTTLRVDGGHAAGHTFG